MSSFSNLPKKRAATVSSTSTENSSDDDEDEHTGDGGGSSSDDDDDQSSTNDDSTSKQKRRRLQLDQDAARLDAAINGFGEPNSSFSMAASSMHSSTLGSTMSTEDSSSDESLINQPTMNGGIGLNDASPGVDDFKNYSNKSMMMMQRMGYKENEGLGKMGQGRIKPIEVSEQKGRRGLGLRLDGLDQAAETFDPTMEHVQLRETAEWLHNSESSDLDELSRHTLESWLKLGKTKMIISDEYRFVEKATLDEILKCKTIFDNLGGQDMRHARSRSNPFESIRGAIFLNRAAVKMANMDSMLDFMFTNPVDEDGCSLVREDDLLYFADVCAGPGGFSEYVLWRKGWQAKGFGFTLRNENDFKLHDFFAGYAETFNPFYGVKDDGNVFDPANIDSLVKHVLSETKDQGVHFMMADGGFSVEGQENIQEILSKQLYLCQCLVALGLVREQGHFVVKMFDLFTPFSVGLIYLMYKSFQQICIFKPNTSRPANSERYLVCKWKKPNTDSIYRHLFEVNEVMWENPNSGLSFEELVPPDEVIMQDEKFFSYIYESNMQIGRNQIAGLLKIAAYCKDTTLKESRQDQIRADCLQIWKVPNAMRKAPQNRNVDKLANDLLGVWADQKIFLVDPGRSLDSKTDLFHTFDDVNDWFFVALDTVENSAKTYRTMFMSKGGQDVSIQNANGSWGPLRELQLQMSPNTLLYGEVVKELSGEGRSQIVSHALHIIDGMVLGGVDIRHKPLRERLKLCEKFALALNKPNKAVTNRDGVAISHFAPIRSKKLYSLADFPSFFDRLNLYKLKDLRVRYGLELRNVNGPSRFYVPRGLLFLNELRSHIKKGFSRSQQKMYYIDGFRKSTYFQDQITDPTMIYASFKAVYTNRKLWTWEQEDQVAEQLTRERTPNLLYRIDLNTFLEKQATQKLAAAAAST